MSNANQSKVIKEIQNTVIDVQTGEILTSETTQTKIVAGEPDYIKLYYSTMLAYNGIDDIPVTFICSMSKFLEWSNEGSPMYFTVTKRVKDVMSDDCGVKSAQINRYLRRAKESGLLLPTQYRGVYEVNPWMIAKGRWESIKQLRTEYNYVDGTWKRTITREGDETNG